MESMRWSEITAASGSAGGNNNHDPSNINNNNSSPGAPTIKNHSVTYFQNYLYCFGGYDGRRNHLTLLLYSIRDQRWIRPHHVGGIGGINGGSVAPSGPSGNNGITNSLGPTFGSDNANDNMAAEAAENPSFVADNGNAASSSIHGTNEANNMIVADAQGEGDDLQGMGDMLQQQDQDQQQQQGLPPLHHPQRPPPQQQQQDQQQFMPPRNQNHPPLPPIHPSANYNNNLQQQFQPHHHLPHHHHHGFLPGDTSVLVMGNPPPGRNGHSATLATDPDDEDNGRIIIIGGWLGTGPLAASDMHVLDISNGGRQLRWYQPAAKGTPPGPCNMHSADYVSKQREVYVFRGGNGREYLNDLHALSTTTLVWRKVETTGQIPQQRANHSSAILDETGELFIFGGWNGTERLNDIHVLDTATSTWTCPHAGGVLPHPRAGMTLTALRGRLYLFGGSGTSSKCFQDLQILDRDEMAWLDVTQYEPTAHGASRHRGYDHVVASSPQEQHQHNGNHHEHHEFVNHNADDGYPQWSFGGYDGSSAPMDLDSDGSGGMGGTMSRPGTFTSSRADWRSRELAARPRSGTVASSPNPNDEDTLPSVLVHGRGPGRRAGHTATAVNRKIYVFGGSCGSDYLNDFYVLDTDPPPHAAVTEPTSLHLIERRLRHFFNDEEFSDVTFIVQGRRVYGHKMILAIVSDCFRAMFTAGFRESSSSEIEITDCSYEAFLAVMEYIYTGVHPNTNASNLGSLTGLPPDYQPHPDTVTSDRTNANLSRILEVLALADRFFLDHLKQICEKQLQPCVTGDTVEFLLQVAQKTNAMQLQAICEHFLRNRDS